MKFGDKIVSYLADTALLLILGMVFFVLTTPLTFTAGHSADYSLWVWGGMAVLWGVAALQWRQGRRKPLYIAVQAVLVCLAMDECYLWVYTEDEMLFWPVAGFAFLEALVFVAAVVFKKGELGRTCLAGLAVILLGRQIVFPTVMTTKTMLGLALGVWLICQAWLERACWLGRRWAAISVIGLLVLSLGTAGGYWYVSQPGIHFYEPRVEKSTGEIKVSVVIPVYNAEKFLKETLDSVRKQTLRDIEIICVNDGSTDNSGRILATYAAHDKRFKIITQENAYIGAAWNAGILAAEGKYIGFIDHDDLISPNYYEDLYQAAEKAQADVAEAAIHYSLMPPLGQVKHSSYKDMFYLQFVEQIDDIAGYMEKMSRVVWDKIYRRSFLRDNQILSTTLRTIFADYYFVLQVWLKANKIAIAPAAAHYYRLSNSSTSKVFHSVADQAIPMLALADELLAQADLSPEARRIWQQKHEIFKQWYMNNYYQALREEDRPAWAARCRQTFGADGCAFSDKTAKGE